MCHLDEPADDCHYFSKAPGSLSATNVYLGKGTINYLGNGDLTVSCKVNPGTDRNLGSAQEFFNVILGCLAGESIVNTPMGPRQVAELTVGDKVQAVDAATGALVYDDVVFTPHRDAEKFALYQDIRASAPAAEESRRLLVTSNHFVPVVQGGKKVFKLAKDVQVGA